MARTGRAARTRSNGNGAPVEKGSDGAAVDGPSPRSRRGAARPTPSDDFSVVVPSHLPARVPGGDHLLLAAFPLAVSRPGRSGVQRRQEYRPGKPYKVIQDTISCATTGRSVTRTLEVYGSKGPVQPSDEDVLIALIQFTHEYLASSPGATLIVTDSEIMRNGGDPLSVMMRLRKIHFKRADLLRRLGIKHLSGKNQQLIEQRMHRLSGVDLHVKNAYFHADGSLATSVGLRLIDSYAFSEGNRYAWFTWSPTMAQLIENGELRALDTDFYFRIDDFLARRLFRHLNIFGKPGRSTYPFEEIVKTRLGLEPSTEYVSKCKDPVERACRELVRLGFLKSYSIDGRFVPEATISIEMPADYQPSESFSLPFEALIDSFRKEAGEGEEPATRGGLWRERSVRLEKLAGRSVKAREAAAAIVRGVYDAHGPSADALNEAIRFVETLVECGVKAHTALPETSRLVESGAIGPEGPSADVRDTVGWWRQKRERGESVGPGLLVSALRDPGRMVAPADDASPGESHVDDEVDQPEPSPEASTVWERLVTAVEQQVGAAATRDWLRPLVPVGLAPARSAAGQRARRELTLWAPNGTFTAFLSGKARVAAALRAEASRIGLARVTFAEDASRP